MDFSALIEAILAGNGIQAILLWVLQAGGSGWLAYQAINQWGWMLYPEQKRYGAWGVAVFVASAAWLLTVALGLDVRPQGDAMVWLNRWLSGALAAALSGEAWHARLDLSKKVPR